jgi:hypothetical protein
VYLQDIIFLNDGNRAYLDEERKVVNWQKCQNHAKYIRELLVRCCRGCARSSRAGQCD